MTPEQFKELHEFGNHTAEQIYHATLQTARAGPAGCGLMLNSLVTVIAMHILEHKGITPTEDRVNEIGADFQILCFKHTNIAAYSEIRDLERQGLSRQQAMAEYAKQTRHKVTNDSSN